MKIDKLKQSVLAGILFMWVGVANATWIDNGAYNTDDETGLVWLDWTETQGQSRNEVEARIATGGDLHGWGYATWGEVGKIWADFGQPQEGTSSPDYVDDLKELYTLFAGGYNAEGRTNWIVFFEEIQDIGPCIPECLATWSDWYGLNLDPNYSSAIFDFRKMDVDWSGFGPDGGNAVLNYESGSYLVHRFDVPEPSSLILISLGLIGLALNNLKKGTRSSF